MTTPTPRYICGLSTWLEGHRSADRQHQLSHLNNKRHFSLHRPFMLLFQPQPFMLRLPRTETTNSGIEGSLAVSNLSTTEMTTCTECALTNPTLSSLHRTQTESSLLTLYSLMIPRALLSRHVAQSSKCAHYGTLVRTPA